MGPNTDTSGEIIIMIIFDIYIAPFAEGFKAL